MKVGDKESKVSPLLLNLLRDPEYQILRKTHYSGSFLGDYVRLLETQMCQMLSWLFDPQEGHGQQDFFVKRLLMSVLTEKHPYLDEAKQFEILSIDYRDVQVFTEFTLDSKKRIDIVIMDVKSKTLIVIERKDGDTAKKGQLSTYRNFVEKNFNTWTSIFILSDSHDKDHKYGDDYFVKVNDDWLVEALSDVCALPDTTIHVKHELSNIRRLVDYDFIYPIEAKWLEVSRRLCERHQILIELLKNTYFEKSDGQKIALLNLTPEMYFKLLPENPSLLLDPVCQLVQSHHWYLSNLEGFYVFEELESEITKVISHSVELECEIFEKEFNFTHVGQKNVLGDQVGCWPFYLSLKRTVSDDGLSKKYSLWLVLNKRSDERLHEEIDALREQYSFPDVRSRVHFQLELLPEISSIDIAQGTALRKAIDQFFKRVISL